MYANQCRNRAIGIMGQYFDMIRFGHGGDLPAFVEAAAMAEIRLNERNDLLFQKIAKLMTSVKPLASSKRDIDCRRHLHHFVNVFRRNGFFKKQGPILFETATRFDRGGGIQEAMTFDEDLDVITNDAARRSNSLYRETHFLRAQHQLSDASERISLDRFEAHLDRAGR